MKLLLDENFRFGWELEYQNDKLGCRLCEVEKQIIIETRYRNLLSNNTQLTLLHRSLYDKVYLTLCEKLSKEHEISWTISCIITQLKELGIQPNASNIAVKLLSNINTGKLIDLYPDLVPIIKECLALTIRKYEYEIRDLQLHPALERVNDGSVTGGEIRPKNKQTLENSITLLQALESKYDFRKDMKVDIECSFHIHISNTKLTHSYGENFQRFMYEYLYTNMERLSNNILQRFLHIQEPDDDDDDDEGKDWCNEYYSPEISSERYNAIAFRDKFNTWEFRFFGNIGSASEGILCLNFAKDCFKYAYNKAHIEKKLCSFGCVCSSIKGRARSLVNTRAKIELGTPTIFTYQDEPAELPPETLNEVLRPANIPQSYEPYDLLGRRTSLCEALGVTRGVPQLSIEEVLREAELTENQRRSELQRKFYQIITDSNNERTGT